MSTTSRLARVFEIEPTLEAMSRRAADLVAAGLRENPRLLLGAATGATPARTYELVGQLARDEPHLSCCWSAAGTRRRNCAGSSKAASRPSFRRHFCCCTRT